MVPRAAAGRVERDEHRFAARVDADGRVEDALAHHADGLRGAEAPARRPHGGADEPAHRRVVDVRLRPGDDRGPVVAHGDRRAAVEGQGRAHERAAAARPARPGRDDEHPAGPP
jgi:hypothetical protein